MPRKIARRRPVKRRAGRKPRRAVRKARASNRTTDYAKVVEGAESYLTTGAQGELGAVFTTSLSQFQRAQEVAHAYKFYRCAKIELQFVPYANFATVGAAGPGRMPQMYFTVDRVANQNMIPFEAEMIERGISPRMFNKKLTYSWKPNLLQHVQMEVNQPAEGGGLPLGINVLNAINSIPLMNKWLPTQQSYGYTPLPPNAQTGQTLTQPSSNPYALKYYGAAYCIDQELGQSQQIGDLITKVTWEFKGPRALKTNAPTAFTLDSPATSMMNTNVVANTQPTQYP